MAVSAVVGLVTAVGAGIAYGFGTAVVLGGFAIGAGLSALSRALIPKPDLGSQMRGTTVTTREPAGPRKLIYGKVRVGGNVVFISHSGTDNKYLHLAVVFATHHITSYEEVWFNDNKIWTSSGGFQDDWGSYVTMDTTKLGTAGQSASSVLTSATGWTSDHKLSGIAYLAFKLEWNADRFPQGVPNITAVIRGKRVLDPRTNVTAFSDNPALCVRDYLLEQDYGLGELNTNIDSTALNAAADLCDEQVSIAGGATQDRYRCNGVIDTSNQIKSNIEQLLSSMGGKLTYSGGKYFIDGAEYRAPTVTIDETVIISAIKTQTKQSRRDIFNGVKGTFISEEKNYKILDYPAQILKTVAGSFVTGTTYKILFVGTTDFTAIGASSNGVGVEFTATGPGSGTGTASSTIVEDGAQINLDMPLPFVTNNLQAQRLAKIALLKSRQQVVISMTLNLAGLKIKVGDTISVNYDKLGYSGKVFEVIGYELALSNNGEIGVQLECIETASAIYDWTTADEEDFLSGDELDLYDGRTVDNVTSLSLTEIGLRGPDGRLSSSVELSWTAPDDAFIEYYKVRYNKTGTTNYFEIQTRETSVFVSGLDITSNYDFRVQAENLLGVTSSGTTLSNQVLNGDTTAPSAPTSVTLTAGINQITCEWTNPTDIDLAFVEVHVTTTSGTPSVSATPAAKIGGEEYILTGLSQHTRFFYLRAVDFSGNKSGYTTVVSAQALLVQSADIGTDAVGSSQIATGAVGILEIADNAVTTIKIANDAVTTNKIANNAVTLSEIETSVANLINGAAQAVDVLNVQIESGDVLDLETGQDVLIQNLGDVAIFVNESNQTINNSINTTNTTLANLEATVVDLTTGTSDIFVQPSAPVAGVDGVPDPIPTFSRWYDSDDSNEPYYWDGSAWQSLADPRIASNTSAITTLQSGLNTANSNISANSSAISVLDTTTVSQGNSITTLSSDVTTLQSSLTTAEGNIGTAQTDITTNATAITNLTTRVTDNEGDITSITTDVTTLQTDLATAEGDITTNSTAISGLTTRVTTAEGNITTNASDITALETTVNDVSTGVVATSNALTALTTRVTITEGDITTNASDITALETTVNDTTTGVAATSSAVTSLASRVTNTEGSINSLASDVTTLQSDLTSAEGDITTNASAITSLTTRVTTAEGSITTNTSDITSLETNLASTDGNVSTNATAISGLDTRLTTAEGSITSQATDITTLQSNLTNAQTNITSNSSAITTLQSRVTSAEGNISSNATDITSLQVDLTAAESNISTNASALTSLTTRVTSAEGTITSLTSDVTTLQSDLTTAQGDITSNSSALTALTTRVTTAEGSITTNSSDITALETTVNDGSTGVAANASAISTLDTRITTAENDITTLSASNITALEVSVDDLTLIQDESDNAIQTEGGDDLLLNLPTDVASATSTATNALDSRIALAEGNITVQSSDITSLQSSLTTAEGNITSNASAISALSTRVTSAEGTITSQSSDITTLQSDLTNAESNITTNASAISALDTRVTTAEGTITSQATDITSLQSDLTTAEGDIVTNAGAITSLTTRVTTAEGTITSQSTDITTLQSTVNDPTSGVSANASGIAGLATRVTSAEGTITSLSADVTTLQSDLTTAEGNITTNATGLTSLTTRVTTAEGTITSNSSDITSLQSSLTTTDGNVSTNATAITGLDTRLTSAEGTITSQSSDITTLQSDITTAEGDISTNATAITGLTTRVTSAEGTITSNSSDITSLQSDVTTAEGNITSNAGAISALDTRVTSAEGTITSQASDITTLQSDLTTAEGNISSNATAVSSLTTRVTTAEGNITSNASSITALTSTVNDPTTGLAATAAVASGASTTAAANSTSITDLEAEAYLTVSAGGNVSGFKATADASGSSFTIQADRFALVSTDESQTTTPFAVDTTTGTVSFNANVEVDGDLIATGSISGGAIGNGQVDTITVASNAITLSQNQRFTNTTVANSSAYFTHFTSSYFNIDDYTDPVFVRFTSFLYPRASGGGLMVNAYAQANIRTQLLCYNSSNTLVQTLTNTTSNIYSGGATTNCLTFLRRFTITNSSVVKVKARMQFNKAGGTSDQTALFSGDVEFNVLKR